MSKEKVDNTMGFNERDFPGAMDDNTNKTRNKSLRYLGIVFYIALIFYTYFVARISTVNNSGEKYIKDVYSIRFVKQDVPD